MDYILFATAIFIGGYLELLQPEDNPLPIKKKRISTPLGYAFIRDFVISATNGTKLSRPHQKYHKIIKMLFFKITKTKIKNATPKQISGFAMFIKHYLQKMNNIDATINWREK